MHRRSWSIPLFFILLATAAVSCSGKAARPGASPADAVELIAQPFPSRAALEAILNEPVPAFPASIDAVPVREWTMKGPLPDAPLGAETDDGAWTQVARSFVATRGDAVTLSPSLRCAARELAVFFAENGGMAAEPVQDFIAARCGFPYALATRGVLTATVKKDATDAALLTGLRKPVEDSLSKLVPEGAGMFGLALARKNDRVVALWLFARPTAMLTAPVVADASGVVHLQGKFLDGADRGRALMNGDGFSVHLCAEDAVARPLFSFRCMASGGDEPRWLTLVATVPGQILGHSVVNTLVASGDASLTWRAPAAPSTAPLPSAEAIAETILPPLNELRVAMGEKPLALAPAQGMLNARLAPYLFAATVTDRARAEQISLGVLAGWDVKGGLVRDGSLELLASHATNAGDWLADALSRPMGRMVLLDPQAEQLALGAYAVPGKSLIATVAASYSFFHGDAHPDVADALAARLLAERRSHGLPDVQRIVGLPGLDTAIHDVVEGKDLEASLMAALQDATVRTGRNMRGLVIRSIDPGSTPLPPVLAATKVPTFAVAVGHHATPGNAWGEYVVMWLWPAD
jgi:hypothetical protein